MSNPSSIPELADASAMPSTNPIVSKKRMREVSVQSAAQSDAENDSKQEIQQSAPQQESSASALNANVPLSRKQRRKQLRSVSKQSNTSLLETCHDTQPRVASLGSSRVISSTMLPEDDLPSEAESTAEVLGGIFVYKEAKHEVLGSKRCKPRRPESPRPARTDVQGSPATVTPARPVLETTLSSPSPLPQTITYAAALSGNKNIQSIGNNAEWTTDEDTVEKRTAYTETLGQLDHDKQDEIDILSSPQKLKRKKRIRVRRRKSRQSTTESTVTSREDDERTVADTAATTPAGSPTKEYRQRQQSITFSIVDTLIEEGCSSLEDDAGPSNRDIIIPKNRGRTRKHSIDKMSPITPRQFAPKKEEAVSTTVVSEKHKSFIDTIREMLTYDGTKESRLPLPPPAQIISPIPQKYISPKILCHSPVLNLDSKLEEVAPEAGPHRVPLMPRNWSEALKWDMTPPVHGTGKVFTDPTQRLAEEARSSEPSCALAVQRYPPLPAPPFRTLWTVSKYLDLKQKMITEHRKEEGRRWAIMKAVEKTLDVQKRREDARWPHNWNVPVEKDRAYMERIIGRVNFLMMRPPQ